MGNQGATSGRQLGVVGYQHKQHGVNRKATFGTNWEPIGRPHLQDKCETIGRQAGGTWRQLEEHFWETGSWELRTTIGGHSETTCGKHVGGLETAGKQLGDTWETTFGRPHPGNKSQKTRQQAEKLRDNNRETVSGKHLAKTENWETTG